jgi:DNA-binding NarL/FixJ family response regulator
MTEARILVVEDEAVVATHISSSLSALGYEVCAMVSAGEEAVRLADELTPDLVVMDVVLAGEMDGIAAAKQIQSRHHIPVVFLTAFSGEDVLGRATAAGPFGYLIKPFRERDLHSTITMALFKHKLEKELRESHEALAAYSADLETKVEERTRDLESSREELAKYSESLEKTNEALKIIIEGIETQKKDFEDKIKQSMNLTVRPILEQLKLQEMSETVEFLIKSLEFNMANLFSSFSFDITRDAHVLTPREARICEMIRAGLSSKQIAKVMSISPQTVLVHRKNIRKKLGVDRSRRNLASFLKARP